MTQDSAQAHDTEASEAASSVGIGEIIRFVFQAARRHALLGSVLGVLVASLGVAFALVVPPEFEATGKVLFNQNARITPVLSNPDRMMPRMDPLADVADIIQKKANLEAIIEELKLVDEWEKSRSPVLKLKDSLMEVLRGPMPEEEKRKALVEMLENAMLVYTEGANGLRIKVYWRDPVVASKVVDVTIKRYLAAQLEEETAVISAAIGILKNEVEKAGKALEPALQEVQRLTRGDAGELPPAEAKNKDDKVAPAISYKRVKKVAPPAGPDPALVERLQKTREAIRQISEPWQRRVLDLKTQLTDLRGVYGPEHPAVLQQQRRINDASVEPSELANLLTEERNLAARIKSAAAETADGETQLVAIRGGGAVDTGELSSVSATSDRDSPELVAAKERLRVATARYNGVDKRLDDAELELTTAQTAFKYRYVVTEEPEPPRKPIKPNRPRLIAASLSLALLLGLMAGGVREVMTGRLIEVWQVRMLGLPLLAEISSPPARRSPSS